MNDFTNGMMGVPAPLTYCDAYIENPPQEAQFKSYGSTPLRRIEIIRERRVSKIRQQQLDRYQQQLANTVEGVSDADDTLPTIVSKVEAWCADMAAGTLPASEVLKNIAECGKVLAAVREVYESAGADAVAATEMVDLDAAEYEARLIERFPSAAQALPVVTEGWLRGEPGAPDPLAEAKT